MCGWVCMYVCGGEREGVVLCCPRPVFKLRTLYRQTDTAVTLCSLPTLTLSLELAHSLLLFLFLNVFNCKSKKASSAFNSLSTSIDDLCFDRALLAERCSVASRSPNELVRCAHCAYCVSLLAAFVFVLLHSCVRVSFSLSHTLTLCSRSVTVCYSDV